jgi:hypothetical protein
MDRDGSRGEMKNTLAKLPSFPSSDTPCVAHPMSLEEAAGPPGQGEVCSERWCGIARFISRAFTASEIEVIDH